MDRWFTDFRASGDPRRLALVFDRAAPELWRVAAHLCRDRHVAEDAVQATFLAAIERRADWDPTRPLLPWLLGLLANRVREERRRAARRPLPDRLPSPRGDVDPAATVAEQELGATLRAALARLDEPYRSTLEQHLLDAWSAAEIADRTGVAAGTVRMRLHRGLEQLRHRLPKGLVAGGLATLALTPASMASMRSVVLAHASTATGFASTGAAVVVASSPGKKVLLGLAAMLLVATAATWASGVWHGTVRGDAGVSSQRAAVDRVAAASPSPGAGDAPATGPALREPVAAPVGQLRVRVLTVGALEPVRDAKLVVHVGGPAPADSPQPLAVGAPRGTRSDAPAAAQRLEGSTDAAGLATFHVPAGPARLQLLEPSTDAASVAVPANGVVEQVLFTSIPIEVALRVVDAGGAPVAGAAIVARRRADAELDVRQGETGADGQWRGRLARGSYLVRAHAEGRASSPAALVSSTAPRATLVLGGAPAAWIGTVRDADGRPIGGAGLVLQRLDSALAAAEPCRAALAGADGRFAFSHLTPGDYVLYAWHGERAARRIARAAAVAIADRTTVVDVDFGACASIDVELVRGDGRPWVGADFHAVAEQQPVHGILVAGSGSTDAHGRLSVAGLPSGRYRLEATVDQEVVRETVELRAGEGFAFRRTIGSGAWLEVQVVDEAGTPLPGWVVGAHDAFAAALEGDALWPRLPQRPTDEKGLARFEDVPDRRTWITVARAGAPAPVLVREVPAKARTTCVLSAAQRVQRRVTGRLEVRSGGGSAMQARLVPLPEMPLMFAGGLAGVVAADGSFVFDAVPAGRYGLSVFALDANGSQQARLVWRPGIEVAGDRDVDLGAIEAACGELPVAVLRSDGVPVERPRLLKRLVAGHPFQSCLQTPAGERILLQDLAAGSWSILALGDNCAPAAAEVAMAGDGQGASIVAAAAATVTVTVRCEDLPTESRAGSWRVLRGDRIWFTEDVPDGGIPYRIGLPAGEYRIEFVPGDQSRGRSWAVGFVVGTGAVEVVARRG